VTHVAPHEVVLDRPQPLALADFRRPVLGWTHTPGHDMTDPAGDEWHSRQPPAGHPFCTVEKAG